jgi:hypothetical protein
VRHCARAVRRTTEQARLFQVASSRLAVPAATDPNDVGRRRLRPARIGAHEFDEQMRKPPVGKHADAPKLECETQTGTLLIIEVDWSARANSFEVLDDRLAAGEDAELAEKRVAFVPGDLDGVSCDVDLHPVEPTRFHFGPSLRYRAVGFPVEK